MPLFVIEVRVSEFVVVPKESQLCRGVRSLKAYGAPTFRCERDDGRVRLLSPVQNWKSPVPVMLLSGLPLLILSGGVLL